MDHTCVGLVPCLPGVCVCAGLSLHGDAHHHPLPPSCTFCRMCRNICCRNTSHAASVTALLSHTAQTIQGAQELSDEHTHTQSSMAQLPFPRKSSHRSRSSSGHPALPWGWRWPAASCHSSVSQPSKGWRLPHPSHQPLALKEHLLHHIHAANTHETLRSVY